jgi:transposase
MTSVAEPAEFVVGGVDTHKDVHVAAVIDQTGRILAGAEFPTTTAGHRRLLAWMRGNGHLAKVGIEGTGSYGAGLARHLAAAGVEVVEVDRPNRQLRRRHGKSDQVDAEAAARAALSGSACGSPKARTGTVESIRVLRVARRSAMRARVQASNQLHGLVAASPDDLRAELRALNTVELVERCAGFRGTGITSPRDATRHALRTIARRWQDLDAEITDHDQLLATLVTEAAPQLVARRGVGVDTAGALLVAAGDNPDRLTHEAAFAAVCGASPKDASSGKQRRHRLNRGGDRQANSALWRIVIVRMSCDPATRTYVERRRAEGKTTPEIMRCLKRYVAREVFNDIRSALTT